VDGNMIFLRGHISAQEGSNIVQVLVKYPGNEYQPDSQVIGFNIYVDTTGFFEYPLSLPDGNGYSVWVKVSSDMKYKPIETMPLRFNVVNGEIDTSDLLDRSVTISLS